METPAHIDEYVIYAPYWIKGFGRILRERKAGDVLEHYYYRRAKKCIYGK